MFSVARQITNERGYLVTMTVTLASNGVTVSSECLQDSASVWEILMTPKEGQMLLDQLINVYKNCMNLETNDVLGHW